MSAVARDLEHRIAGSNGHRQTRKLLFMEVFIVWIRKDVYKLAERLGAASGIDPDHLYAWLVYTGKEKGCNPRKLDFTTGAGLVFVTGERDTNYIETYKPAEKWTEPCTGPDYEELILARQEAWMD